MRVAVRLVNIDRDKLIATAGGDPWQVNAAVQHGKPEDIDRLGLAFHRAGQAAVEADSAFARARQRFENAWNRSEGDYPINDSSQVELTTTSLGVEAARLPEIAAALEDIAAALAEAQRDSATCMSKLEKQLKRTDSDLGGFIDLQDDSYLTDAQRSLMVVEIQGLDQKAVDDTKVALHQVVFIRDRYADTLRETETCLRVDGYDPALITSLDQPLFPVPDQPALPVPAVGTSAGDVNKWWNSLAPEQKTKLIGRHPPDLGNLNGIPMGVRNEINQAVMNDDLSRVRDIANAQDVPVDEVLGDPGWFGLTPALITRYNNASRTVQGLAASGEATDEWSRTPELYLLKYLPEAFGGDGAAAIVMGNPDVAANTAVLVQGAGSGVKQGTLTDPDGARLYNEANRADWGNDTAVVIWVGYEAPNTWADPGLYEPTMARTGGQALAADVNALAVTHQSGPTHLTVVGHSYGSTTVADAAAGYGMRANDVVLVGCPGTDLAKSAADFHLRPGGHVYVGGASQDQVSWFGEETVKTPLGGIGLGRDPALDAYGSVRFKAEVPGFSVNAFYDHMHYFDNDSESLYSISDVVSGHGDALKRDGMTARHRGEYGLPAFVDPEATRPATTGHRHRGPSG